MIHCLGTLLLFSIIIGGVYLYFKVAKLNSEIVQQNSDALRETDSDKQ